MAAVAAGGCAGALARVGLVLALPHPTAAWPWATFAVNTAGSFLLGYGATRLDERLPLSAYRRPLLATGICGALTTFSTLQVELLRMLEAGRVTLAAGYALASLGTGLAAVWTATALGRGIGMRR
jgi:fluoride exporter